MCKEYEEAYHEYKKQLTEQYRQQVRVAAAAPQSDVTVLLRFLSVIVCTVPLSVLQQQAEACHVAEAHSLMFGAQGTIES